MILILVPANTSRIDYVFGLIFTTILKVDYRLTTNQLEYDNSSDPKFAYGIPVVKSGLFYGAAGLLMEQSIQRQQLTKIESGDIPGYYGVNYGKLNFDPFASSFYLVTRYEEYLPHLKDRHGRYMAEESLAFTEGFLERPMVNLWALKIKSHLLEYFPELYFPQQAFSFLPTIDIDNAYAYKYKGFVRNAGAILSLLFRFEFKKLKQRLWVNFGFQDDPYDTYEKQYKIHKQHNLDPLYFMLLGDYGKFDKNLSHEHPKYISLMKILESRAEVCLHPSYGSSKNKQQIGIEKERLEKIIGRTVKKSRNHFIKISLPETYKNLIDAGFEDDYSMGYPDKVGYRASIATPFYFYNLREEKITNLKVHPFVVMDVTLKKYLHIRSKDVIPFLKPILEECKAVGGNFTFIFHNESLGGEKMWKNWSELYEKIIKLSMK